MNIRLLIMILSSIVISSAQCAVTQKLKAASGKIASVKKNVKSGTITAKCSQCSRCSTRCGKCSTGGCSSKCSKL